MLVLSGGKAKRAFALAAFAGTLGVASCGGQTQSTHSGGGGTPAAGGVAGSVGADAGAGARGGTGASAGMGALGGTGGNGGAAGQDAGREASAGASAGGGCSMGTKLCNGRCVAIDDPAYGCAPGSCTPCTLAHATAKCASGVCVVDQCGQGYADCNGRGDDGCEIDTASDVNNCGICGRACSFLHAPAECTNGQCLFTTCDPGWGNCDGSPYFGCEYPLNTTVDCGRCGQVCLIDHASASCASGKCTLTACDSGWGDCDSDGQSCETDLLTNSANCGKCGHACASGQNCTSGQCG